MSVAYSRGRWRTRVRALVRASGKCRDGSNESRWFGDVPRNRATLREPREARHPASRLGVVERGPGSPRRRLRAAPGLPLLAESVAAGRRRGVLLGTGAPPGPLLQREGPGAAVAHRA